MNFLLHAHFALADTGGDAAVGLGSMLPDLYRMIARRVRARRGLAADARAAGDEGAIVSALDGIDHHLDADVWFHDTRVFTVGERALAEDFEAETAGGTPRIRLFAHAAWEMCLDGALVRELGEARSLEMLGSMISSPGCEAHPLALEIAQRHAARSERARGDVEGPNFVERLGRLLDAVGSGALPLGYATAEGVAYRLAGVRAAFGFPPPMGEQRDAWLRALDRAANRADAALLELRADPARPRRRDEPAAVRAG